MVFARSATVSVITCVRDKKQFSESAATILRQVCGFEYEYIVVDWGSRTQDVLKELKACAASKEVTATSIRYLQVKAKVFNRGLALNLGFRWATGQWVLTFDCDLLVKEKYLKGLHGIAKGSPKLCLWCLGTEKADGQIRRWCGSGIMLIPFDALYSIAGYDESFQGYGEEDIDFRNRLMRAGYKIQKVTKPGWVHMTHSHKERGQAQFCARVSGGHNPNTYRRLRNDNDRIVVPNKPDWGQPSKVKHVEVK